MAEGRRGARRRGEAGDARETGASATARRGVGGGFLLAARLVMLLTAILVTIIVVAILLKVLGGNMDNSIVKGITDLGKTLVGPFKDLFKIKDAKLETAVNWGLAALLYFAVGSIIASILRRIGSKSHPDRAT